MGTRLGAHGHETRYTWALVGGCVHVYIVHILCTIVDFTIFALSLVPRSPLPRNETNFYHGHSWFILVLDSLWDVGENV